MDRDFSARAVTRWNRACDQRLATQVSYSHSTVDNRHHCLAGDQVVNWRLGLVQALFCGMLPGFKKVYVKWKCRAFFQRQDCCSNFLQEASSNCSQQERQKSYLWTLGCEWKCYQLSSMSSHQRDATLRRFLLMMSNPRTCVTPALRYVDDPGHSGRPHLPRASLGPRCQGLAHGVPSILDWDPELLRTALQHLLRVSSFFERTRK